MAEKISFSAFPNAPATGMTSGEAMFYGLFKSFNIFSIQHIFCLITHQQWEMVMCAFFPLVTCFM
jgi:hypothetical protein